MSLDELEYVGRLGEGGFGVWGTTTKQCVTRFSKIGSRLKIVNLSDIVHKICVHVYDRQDPSFWWPLGTIDSLFSLSYRLTSFAQ